MGTVTTVFEIKNTNFILYDHRDSLTKSLVIKIAVTSEEEVYSNVITILFTNIKVINRNFITGSSLMYSFHKF